MEKMFKATLKPEHPYVGYTLFSNTPDMFKDNTEYLARGDGNSISGNYAINLNGIYESTFTDIDYNKSLDNRESGGRNVRDYLVCAALAQNDNESESRGICDTGNYFNHYTVVNRNNAPYNEEITLPFSVNSSSKRYYINYMAFGYSRSNTPYVGLGSFMTPGTMLDVSLNDQSYYYGNGDIIETQTDTGGTQVRIPLYTYKESGVWSTQMCNMLCEQYMSSKLNGLRVTCNVFSYTGYRTESEMISGIGSQLGSYLSACVNSGNSIDSVVNAMNDFLGILFSSNEKEAMPIVGVEYDIDGSDVPKLVFYKLVISKLEPGENQNNAEGYHVFKINSEDYKVKYTKITPEDKFSYHKFEKILEYLLGNEKESIAPELIYTGYISKIIDESTKGYGIDASAFTKDNSFEIKTVNTRENKIYSVVRLTGPYIATSAYLYNSIFGRKFVNSLGKVEKGKFNRFDAAVISGGRKSLQNGVKLGGNGENVNTYSSVFDLNSDGSFIPRREGSRGTHSINMLNQFRTIDDSSTAGGYNFGFLSFAKSECAGSIYVSTIRIKLDGNTTSSVNSIIIYGPNSNTTIKLDNGGVYDESLGYTTYTVNFTESTSVSYIKAGDSSNTKYCMDARFCGLQQMIRSCSANNQPATGDYATKYSSIFSSDDRSKASQWSAAKVYGYISFSVSGGNQYDAESETATNTITIIGAEVEIADKSEVTIYTNKASLKEGRIDIPDASFSLYDNRYALAVQTEIDNDATTIKSPFLYSMSGKPTSNGNAYLYEDSSTFNQSFTTETFPTLLTISTDSTVLPGTNCGSYKNNFGSSYSGNTFSNSTVVEASVATASSDVFAIGENNNKGISNYSIITTINESTSNPLTTEFNDNKNEIVCKLPGPGLLSKLIYESVEFNGASAWTFTRSMPLEPASAENPHILLYRIETWIETEQQDSSGNTIKTVEKETTLNMKFDAAGTKIYSGSDIAKMDFATANVKNNIYLKYNDNVTNDFNAIATGLPFYILDASTEKKEYYGGTPLKIDDTSEYPSKYSIDNDSSIEEFWSSCPDFANMTEEHYNEIYKKLNDELKKRIKKGTSEVAVVGCSGSPEEKHMTPDKHKIMYIGVAFYNPREEMIPINMIFNVTYTVETNNGITKTYNIPHALSHFFPRDSMLYMAGNSYRQKTIEENENKIKFNRVKGTEDDPLYISTDEGAHIVAQDTSIKGGQDTDGNSWSSELDEVINIGEDSEPNLTDEQIQKLPTSEISANSVRENGLYGILNKYSGVVEYIATGHKDLPDNVIKTPERIKEYFTSVKGKCIKSYQNICFFPNMDGNIKQWIL